MVYMQVQSHTYIVDQKDKKINKSCKKLQYFGKDLSFSMS